MILQLRIRCRDALTLRNIARILNAEFFKDAFSKAPVRERGLNQIYTDQCGPDQPPGTHPDRERHTDQNERPRNDSDIFFDRHGDSPFILFVLASRPAGPSRQSLSLKILHRTN